MPTVKVNRVKEDTLRELTITLAERWEEVNKILDQDSPQARKHREKLFGTDTKIKTGELFGEIALCKRDGMPEYHVFRELELKKRAQYIAFSTLDSMKEIIERHESILKENKETQLARHRKKPKKNRR